MCTWVRCNFLELRMDNIFATHMRYANTSSVPLVFQRVYARSSGGFSSLGLLFLVYGFSRRMAWDGSCGESSHRIPLLFISWRAPRSLREWDGHRREREMRITKFIMRQTEWFASFLKVCPVLFLISFFFILQNCVYALEKQSNSRIKLCLTLSLH